MKLKRNAQSEKRILARREGGQIERRSSICVCGFGRR
jgi:hypothetical protein